MDLRCRHAASSMYRTFLHHAMIVVFTAVVHQEAACIERFYTKNGVNILDLEKRIKLFIADSKATH